MWTFDADSAAKLVSPTVAHPIKPRVRADSPLRLFLGHGLPLNNPRSSHHDPLSFYSRADCRRGAFCSDDSAIPRCTAFRCIQASLSVGVFFCSQPHRYLRCPHLCSQPTQLPGSPSNLFFRAPLIRFCSDMLAISALSDGLSSRSAPCSVSDGILLQSAAVSPCRMDL